MDIEHLKYFTVVVKNGFNLSEASKKLHISQPALSQYILKFEKEENVDLFERKAGRLIGLTAAGENFFANANVVIDAHDDLIKELRENSKRIKGVVRIGVPPLILSVLFTEILSKLILQNPFVRFDIIEKGAFELKRMLALDELDFAVILSPSDLNPNAFDEILIHTDELTAYMSADNPLAQKERITWTDLKHANLAVFNDTFMIHHQLMRKFSAERLEPKIKLMSGSWDFLLEVTKTSELITILPSPVRSHVNMESFSEKHFDSPISWHVVLTFPFKPHHTMLETYVRDSIVNYFTKGEDVKPAES